MAIGKTEINMTLRHFTSQNVKICKLFVFFFSVLINLSILSGLPDVSLGSVFLTLYLYLTYIHSHTTDWDIKHLMLCEPTLPPILNFLLLLRSIQYELKVLSSFTVCVRISFYKLEVPKQAVASKMVWAPTYVVFA